MLNVVCTDASPKLSPKLLTPLKDTERYVISSDSSKLIAVLGRSTIPVLFLTLSNKCVSEDLISIKSPELTVPWSAEKKSPFSPAGLPSSCSR